MQHHRLQPVRYYPISSVGDTTKHRAAVRKAPELGRDGRPIASQDRQTDRRTDTQTHYSVRVRYDGASHIRRFVAPRRCRWSSSSSSSSLSHSFLPQIPICSQECPRSLARPSGIPHAGLPGRAAAETDGLHVAEAGRDRRTNHNHTCTPTLTSHYAHH